MLFFRLGCWCKPELCHGDVLVELVNKLYLNDGDKDKSAEPVCDKGFDLNEDFPLLISESTECTMRQPHQVVPKSQDVSRDFNSRKKKGRNLTRKQPPYVAPCDDGITRVVHMERYKGDVIQDCDVYIGRENRLGGWNLPESKWANPFTKQEYKEKGTRLRLYREHILSTPELLESLHELKGKRYGEKRATNCL